MSGEILLQFLANAIVVAALYALLGLSFGLIYSTTQILHFAHGAIYLAAAYLFFAFHVLAALPVPVALALAVLLAGLLGVLTMRGLYDPLLVRRASGLTIMIASLGFFIVVENVIVLLFTNDSRVVASGAVVEGLRLGPVVVTPLQLTIVAVTAVVLGLVHLMLARSGLGRALRGMSDDSGMAEIVGIDVRRLRYAVLGLGSMIAALAAVLVALDVGLRPTMGLQAVLVAAIAVIVGGVGPLFAGVVGGVVVGFIQNFGILYVAPKWQNLITFAVLIAMLLFRPAGLFGRRV
jgi:branched-chain amino acid transport system permease protein